MFIINNIKVRIIYGINILNRRWKSKFFFVNDMAIKFYKETPPYTCTIYWPNIEPFIPLGYLKIIIYLSI